MKVDLAIDVPGGTVSVFPKRSSHGTIQEPLQMYTGLEGAIRKASDYDKDYKDYPGTLTRDKVPNIVNFPRQIWVRPRIPGEPFSPSEDQPYTEVVHPARLATINPPVIAYNHTVLTQLRTQGPPKHLFYSKGQPQDDRSLGAPWSFDSTYLLLTLSVAHKPIPPFRVLFRSRMLPGANLSFRQVPVCGEPPSYVATVRQTPVRCIRSHADFASRRAGCTAFSSCGVFDCLRDL